MIANEFFFGNTVYFIYWIEKQEILGVSDGCSMVFEERFDRKRRSEWLKTELTEATWRRIVEGNEIRIDDVSSTSIFLKRNTRTVSIQKCMESQVAEKLARNFRLLVEVSANQHKKSAEETKKKFEVVQAKPATNSKLRGFALPVKKKAKLDDDEEIED